MFYQEHIPEGPRLVLRSSLSVEIDWVLSAALQRRTSSPAVLEDLYRDHPDLAERVRGLWGPEEALSYPGFLEISILAHHGGLLFATDSGELLGRLEELAATSPEDLPLLSETPDDRERLLRRLRLLRSSSRRRKRYAQVLREVWAEVGPSWEEHGRAAVDAAIADRSALLATKPDWREFARTDCAQGTSLDRLVAALGDTGELAVVPAYFTHKGLIVDLPGVVVVGVRTASLGAEARIRTERLAQRLRAISDPTRLAILSTLSAGPMTVTEISTSFCLAQPTVSNHVKVLREAGVVANGIDGRSRQIAVQQSAVEDLLEGLRGALGGAVLEATS